jgi:hypothetical protein
MRLAWLVLALTTRPAAAITITIDYTYDTSNFFAGGNPQGAAAGAQAKAALEAAASYYSAILVDTFDPITIPGTYHSTVQNSTTAVDWTWQAQFQHPASTTTNLVSVTNPTIGTDQFRVYVGARALDLGTAGKGGPGSYVTALTHVTGSGGINSGDQNNINAITASLNSAITTRGESSGFSDWGGVIAFDNDGSTPWFFNHLGTPSGNVTDFYSVALHELEHTLGFGVSTNWTSLVDNSKFVGLNAEHQYGDKPIPVAAAPNQGHWDYGIQSVVYGTTTAQETLMDPDIQNGTRKKVTALDAAALQDIGWSIAAAPGVNGDYNNNGIVDASDYAVWRKRLNQSVTLPNDTTPGAVTAVDYTVWRANFGKSATGSGSGSSLVDSGVPEPTSGLLAILLVVGIYFNRSLLRR